MDRVNDDDPEPLLLDLLGDQLPPLVQIRRWAATALAVFLYAAFFRNLPRDDEEAAALDGAGPGRAFLQVVLPLMAPVTGTVSTSRVRSVQASARAPPRPAGHRAAPAGSRRTGTSVMQPSFRDFRAIDDSIKPGAEHHI